MSPSNKIVVDQFCKVQGVGCDSIYALGDVCEGKLELTPTAILDGRMLAGRLLNVHNQLMDWNHIATTVFTPLEYTSIGLSEEDVIQKYGEGNFKV